MKRTIWLTSVVIGIGTLCGVAIQMKINREKPAPETITESAADSQTPLSCRPTQSEKPAVTKHRLPPQTSTEARAESSVQASFVTPTPADAARAGQAIFNQAIETLLSPQSTAGQRQAAFDQLSASGKLDQAMNELEQRMANDPHSAQHSATLGRLYLQKAGTIQDVREQGILAMKADLAFDAALNVDPSNWEARFTKAVAMSYWPTQMDRGQEVMQHFVTLVEQQEAQTPQTQFAQSYLWLGKEYEKYGHTAEAKEIWQRGAALFPDNAELRAKLQEQ